MALNCSIRSGFTLIELSIVLIIIGLVTASVLVGKDLIYASQIRKQISQIQGYELAAQAFKTKYNCLPGDCSNASSLGLGNNGDGNGEIYEDVFFWQHLSAANMIEFKTTVLGGVPGISTPPPVFKGVGVSADNGSTGGVSVFPHSARQSVDDYFDGSSGHALAITLATDNHADRGVYYPRDAQAMDAKIDDGYAASGKVYAVTFTYPDLFTRDNECAIDTGLDNPMRYNINSTYTGELGLCDPIFLMNF